MNAKAQPRLYPVSPSQRMNIRARRLGHAKQVNNIPTMLLVERPLDLDLLRRSVEQAVARNDSFGIRLVRDGLQSQQYFGEREALVLETVDFSGQTEEAMDRFFERVARIPLPLYNKPLAKIYVTKAPDGATGVYLCVSHLIMDMWAIGLFYRDVFQIYAALADGTPPPAPLTPYEDLLCKELEYLGSPREAKDREFWQNELERFGRPPTYSAIDGTHSLERYRKLIRKPEHPFGHVLMLRTAAKHENLPVPAADAEAISRFCTENRIPLQAVFLLALRTWLARTNGFLDDVTINYTVARRGTLIEKKAGGTRASGMMLRTVVPPDATFSEALQEVCDTLNQQGRHAEFPFMEFLKMQQATYGMKPYEWYAMVSFTLVTSEFDLGLPVRMRSYPTGTTPMPVYVILTGDPTRGSLSILYEYQYKRINGDSVRNCHNYMLETLRAGIGNPDITMRELLNLDVPLA